MNDIPPGTRVRFIDGEFVNFIGEVATLDQVKELTGGRTYAIHNQKTFDDNDKRLFVIVEVFGRKAPVICAHSSLERE